MGMHPVGYYDLSVAGVPVHATAFRPVGARALEANPFRLFTSLLRLELIEDPALRARAHSLLDGRRIFSDRLLELVATHRAQSGLLAEQAQEFVAEALKTFQWHGESTVSQAEYARMHAAHRLIADVVCFGSPHINHLTPRTLDIDAAQQEMIRRGLPAKDTIEGPPARSHPILLRQTSFKALEEPVRFAAAQASGVHTARFGEIEQRGQALTRKGRALYDHLLSRAGAGPVGLAEAFSAFPDDLHAIRAAGLGFFRYTLTPAGQAARGSDAGPFRLDRWLADGRVAATPITYEDFLPVSAAGIFQSNLGDGCARDRANAGGANQAAFEEALGAPVLDEFSLYAAEEAESIAAIEAALQKKEKARDEIPGLAVDAC